MLQLIAIIALGCGVFLLPKRQVGLGIGFVLLVVPLTWCVMGRWAMSLTPEGCRVVMALTATAMMALGVGVTLVSGQAEFFPVAFLFSGLAIVWPWMSDPILGVLCDLLAATLVFAGWWALFRGWDSYASFLESMAQTGAALVSILWLLLVPLLLPVLLAALFGDCYRLSGHHPDGSDIAHLPVHCWLHLGVIVASVGLGAVLTMHARKRSLPLAPWFRLVVWGWLNGLVTLYLVGLIPIRFQFTLV